MIDPIEPPWVAFAAAMLRDHLLSRGAAPSTEVAELLEDIPETESARDALHRHLEQPTMLAGLRDRLAIGTDAIEVLSLLLACESAGLPGLLSGLAIGIDEPSLPSVGLIAGLFPPPHQGLLALAPGSGLQRACLLRRSSAGPWHVELVGVEPGLLWTLAGDQGLDPDLPADCRHEPGDFFRGPVGPLLAVSGADPDARMTTIWQQTCDAGAYISPIPQDPRQWSALIREATLTASVVVLEVDESTLPAAARRAIAWTPHLQWALSSPERLALDELGGLASVGHHLDIARSPFDAEPRPGSLQVQVTATQRRLLGLRGITPEADPADYLPYLRAGRSPLAADRIIPSVTLDDVVLTADQRTELTALQRDRSVGHIVSDDWGFAAQRSLVLLQGPPGTGKSLTAEALAGSLGQELLIVNVAALVSKYIGETQKNFEQLFAVLDELPAVLLIDEVDALFGRRTGVQSSNDRYANLETAYLLQRTERMRGVVVMTTNLTANIDPAFIRRFDTVITMDSPKLPERLELWQRLVPPACPGRGDVDFAVLAADFDMTGAMINSAARRAALDAAATGTSVSTEALRRAAERQMRKHGWLS